MQRVLGTLKEFRALDRVTLRGLDKVELHCLLSIIVMQVMALRNPKEQASLQSATMSVL